MRARDVLRGEDAIKAGAERYLPRLELQSDAEYAAYTQRAAFFNGTARTAEGFLGLVFRRAPFLKLSAPATPLGRALAAFANDTDLLGTTLDEYAKTIVREVLAVGRAGTLIDWEGQREHRAYLAPYAAENILNWTTRRRHGRHLLTQLVLHEPAPADPAQDQIRVLKLVPASAPDAGDPPPSPREQSRARQQASPRGEGPGAASVSQLSTLNSQLLVELYRPQPDPAAPGQSTWVLAERLTPRRRGQPLPMIPFVFHGPCHSRPDIDKLPLADLIAVNLDHYRLDADFKHGLHYTALPTAWVSGFDKSAVLRIGAQTAWVADQPGASAGFLEYKGQGLETFERALDRDERHMALLGSRLLENQKRVAETAETIELRQSGEDSILGSLAHSLTHSLSQVLRWTCWWHSAHDLPDHITSDEVSLTLNNDFSTKGLSAQELQAVVASWQANAFSRDTLLDLLRRGAILPDTRTNQEEKALLESPGAAPRKSAAAQNSAPN
jgi:hypothetical protein